MNVSEPFFPPEYAPVLDELSAQPEGVRELFRYALAVMMIDDGKAKIVEMREDKERLHMVLETLTGDTFAVVRPEMSEEEDQAIFNRLRRLVQEQSSGPDGWKQHSFLLDVATLRHFTRTSEANYDYAWEKLHLAVLQMAQSPETLQQRLYHAYVAHLVYLRGQDLPEELETIYKKVEGRCSELLEAGKDAPRPFDALGDVECSQIIVAILAMYDAVVRYQPPD